MLKAPFGKDIILVKVVESRPFIPIKPLSINLGIDPFSQERRVANHAEINDLDAKTVMIDIKPRLAIPLEDLSWFLRTIRPHDHDVRAKVKQYREGAVLALFWYWFSNADQFSSKRSLLRQMNKAIPVDPSLPPKRKPKLSIEDADEMRRLSDLGLSRKAIGGQVGCSATTVSMILNGKYPINLKYRDS
jgi:hypothetical protein